MNKEELLQQLAMRISTGEIRSEEVVSRLNLVPISADQPQMKKSTTFSATKILYVLGASIVVIGIIFFVAQIWNDIGSAGRISVTLGIGLLITLAGSVLLKSRPGESIGMVFHAIGGLLIPGGAMVTLSELSTGIDHPWVVAITFVIIFAFYLLLNSVHKNVVLTLFTIANGTASIYMIVNAIIQGSFYNNGDIYAYLTMVIGASYLLFAHSFRGGWNDKLVGSLYLLGSAGFLGAAFSQIFDSTAWQILYVFIVLGGLFLSVKMKSGAILAMSTFALIAYVSYITSEYFADSIGWPVTLIILGFVFIGLGYASITINKRYISD